jgi:hypothetical protein
MSNWARTLSRCVAVRLARTLRMASGSPARRPGFELGDHAQHLQREHALWRGGVGRVVQAEMRASGFELLDDGEEMADRAGQAIEPDHDQVSLGRISCSRRASTGSRGAQPAARNSSGCGSVPCPSVETYPRIPNQSDGLPGRLSAVFRHEFRSPRDGTFTN